MGFFDWYLKCIKEKYADFDGRARRTEYWMFTLVNFIVYIAVVIVFSIIHLQKLAGLYGLATLVPTLAVGARRLHDTGKSAWLLLLGLIPFIGALVLLVFFVIEGDSGPNPFGPDPKKEFPSTV